MHKYYYRDMTREGILLSEAPKDLGELESGDELEKGGYSIVVRDSDIEFVKKERKHTREWVKYDTGC